MNFDVTFFSVLMLLIYTIPAFFFTKFGKMKEESISSFAIILVKVCTPCLIINSLTSVDFTGELASNLVIFFLMSTFVQLAMLGTTALFFWKKGLKDVKYRIGIFASTFANAGYFGIPILRALMPDYPEAVAMGAAYVVSLNFLANTLGSYIITKDKKFIKAKAMLINPATIGVSASLFFFFVNMPNNLSTVIGSFATMSTPLCMLILGMRLAISYKHIVKNCKFSLLIVFIKQILMPLFVFAFVHFLPIDEYLKTAIFILAASPVASISLSFAELLGQGQKPAASTLLLGTMGSLITMPILLLLI